MAEWLMQFHRKMLTEKSVEAATIYENLLTESDDKEVFAEEVNLSSAEPLLAPLKNIQIKYPLLKMH